ncbi:hypothetical protein J7E68_05535 [Microbacterium sp. ISL-103]|uniref:hypothetical protein n=1 Tax=Microbacterium sp. ISL-103 TaxID=2819156 RepID=UPI001BE734E8|nr:hypothetical protein [Microbacterium sp. ISL-103]MBT2474048.1 hypothetical protein [Microbacterium sp. ISL-103]
MSDPGATDAGMVKYITIGVLAGVFVGVLVGMFVEPIGVGFGISGGLFLGILVATIAWLVRRQAK